MSKRTLHIVLTLLSLGALFLVSTNNAVGRYVQSHLNELTMKALVICLIAFSLGLILSFFMEKRAE